MTEHTGVLPLQLRRDRFDPAPELIALQQHSELGRIRTQFGPAWLVTRDGDVRAVLGNTTAFTSTGPLPVARQQLAEGKVPVEQDSSGFLPSYDPPDHTRLRHMLMPEFTVRRMRRIEPRVVEIVTEHLDAMAQAAPPVDLVAIFALPIPSLVICELLGAPYAERVEFQRRTATYQAPEASPEECGKAFNELRAYLGELLARHRVTPGEDLLGMLIREHGDELTDTELEGIGHLLLLAGHETTANMLGMGTHCCCWSIPTSSRSCAIGRRQYPTPSKNCCATYPSCRTARRAPQSPRSPSAGPPSHPVTSSSARCPRPTGRSICSTTARNWTWLEARSRTSPSATASTTASAHRWPGWSCGSPFPRCCADSRACALLFPRRMSPSGLCLKCMASTHCLLPGKSQPDTKLLLRNTPTAPGEAADHAPATSPAP